MPKPVSWANDAHSIRERATNSKAQTYTRQAIEHLFGVRRVAAQNLMKLIGRLNVVGSTHVVDRADVLDFLDSVIASDSITAGVLARQLSRDPTPRVNPLKLSLPSDLRTVTCRDLPENILLTPGELTVRGNSAEEIVEALMLLAQILTNDLDTAVDLLQPPKPLPDAGTSELREMFARLEADERSRHSDPELTRR